jgi:NADPH:quinone reductase-like Zn-dependent oxidoreductase
VIARGDDIVACLGKKSVDVVVDNVGGSTFPQMLKVLKIGGKFVSSGAIGGPLVNLDMRYFYLKDLTLKISTYHHSVHLLPKAVQAVLLYMLSRLIGKTYVSVLKSFVNTAIKHVVRVCDSGRRIGQMESVNCLQIGTPANLVLI